MRELLDIDSALRNIGVALWCLVGLGVCAEVRADTLEERAEYFENTCTIAGVMFGVDCGLIRVPRIKYTDDDAYRGFYLVEVENTIWINRELRGNERKLVIVHEMAHYILHKSKTVPLAQSNTYTTCLSEVMSFGISNWYASIMLKDKSLQRHNWVDSYPHCQFMKEEYIVVN